MQPRDVHERHRASTPLELLVDLSFVVGVSQVAASLHAAIIEGHVRSAIVAYPIVFFSIWWAWVNFTWFASSYDTDDVPYRLATLLQIAGVLVITAGVPRAFDHQDMAISTFGYAITRVGLISQWMRVSRTTVRRRCSQRRSATTAIPVRRAGSRSPGATATSWCSALRQPRSDRVDGRSVAGDDGTACPSEVSTAKWAPRPRR